MGRKGESHSNSSNGINNGTIGTPSSTLHTNKVALENSKHNSVHTLSAEYVLFDFAIVNIVAFAVYDNV